MDQHLSHTAELLRADVLDIDFAILEAVAITEDGMIIPTTSIGNSLAFSLNAKSIIIEMNMAQSAQLEGLHDLYEPGKQGERLPIPLAKQMTELEQSVFQLILKSKGNCVYESIGFAIDNCSSG